MRNFKVIISFLLLTLSFIKSIKYSCKNTSGEEVDWFAIIMIPQSVSETDAIKFGYFDSAKKTMVFMDQKKGNFPPLEMTSSLNIKTSKNVNYFFWNDDSGDSDKYTNKGKSSSSSKSNSSSKAHSKGGLVYDNNGGYFLSHSLPRFPDIVNDVISDEFPSNAGVFAQSWICISISKNEAIKVAGELNIINPQIYIKVDEDQVESPPNDVITKLIKNRGDPKLPAEHQSTIVSKGNVSFDIFSKSKVKNDLPWDARIPNNYKDSFYSETWTKPERLPSICNQEYEVNNILSVKFGNYKYEYDNEHSKWGVAEKKSIVCIGDLNRCESQKSRGGLVICFNEAKLADTMRKAITDFEPCKRPKQLVFLNGEKN